jgi:hypothetical protein
VPTAGLRRDLGGHGRRRPLLRHLRSRAAAGRPGAVRAARAIRTARAAARAPRTAGSARARRTAARPCRGPGVGAHLGLHVLAVLEVVLAGLPTLRVGPPVADPGRRRHRPLRVGTQQPLGAVGPDARQAGRRPRPRTDRAAARPRRRGAGRPRGARAQALLQQGRLRRPGGPQPRRPPRAYRGLLHQVRAPVLLLAQAAPRRRGARAVPRGGLPGTRRPRLDLPRRGPARVRPLGGAQGPAGHRRPGRHGRRDLRAALPRGDRARQHRADLQLRRAPRPAHRLPRRLHRHGVRRRQVAQGDRQRPPHPRGPPRPAAGGTGVRLRHRGAGGARPPAQPQPAVLRLQGRTPCRPRTSSS